jgi:tetratricopeptide (TPR) repeat protein
MPDKTLRARLLVQRANLLVSLGKPDLALESLAKATPDIDRQAEPRFWYCAVEQQLLILTGLGRFQEAGALLPEVRHLANQDAAPVDVLRVRWVEARLAAGQGDPKRAECLYREIHEGFLRHNLAFSAAVVTLELCRLLLEQGRLEEVKTQAAGTLAEFHRQKVEPEILSALALVEQAVLAQRLTLEVLTKARSLLDRQGHQA